MARVVVLGTGGTIASKRQSDQGAEIAALSSNDLISALAGRGYELPAGVSISTEQFCTIGSYLFDLDVAFRIAKRADAILAEPDVVGVVVTQGTDTMEESAFMADLVMRSAKPIVYTGAQYPADDPDPDGPRNLACAIALAAADAARGLGAVIAFDGEVHAARDVTKRHASRPGTFFSSEHGKVADIDSGTVVVHRRPLLRRSFETTAIEPKIDLIRLVMGSDARFIACAKDTGARGIVVEAFGRGNANHDVVAGIRAATAAGIPVVVTSRCPEGRVKPIYGNGGGKDVEAAGAIFAGDLQGLKARILLSVALGAGSGIGAAEAVRSLAG